MALIVQRATASWDNFLASLGKFARLSYELREMIWLELSPTGRDLGSMRTGKTRLDILRTSRWLYEEISRLIYQDSTLRFGLESKSDPCIPWGKVYFTNRDYGRNRRGAFTDWPAGWIFQKFIDACHQGLIHLPYHKIQNITVNLFPTVPERAGFAMLWARAYQLVKLLEGASSIQRLNIRLAERDGRDWLDEDQCMNRPCVEKYDHEIVLEPFWSLKNTGTIEVQARSVRLRRRIDWPPIDEAIEACLSKAREVVSSRENINREHRQTFLDYNEESEYLLRAAVVTYPLQYPPEEMCSALEWLLPVRKEIKDDPCVEEA